MYREDLVEKVSESTGLAKREVEKVIISAVNTVRDELVNGGKLTLVGFGSLEVTSRSARKGINPQTKKVVEYPGYKTVRWKTGKALKDSLNK